MFNKVRVLLDKAGGGDGGAGAAGGGAGSGASGSGNSGSGAGAGGAAGGAGSGGASDPLFGGDGGGSNNSGKSGSGGSGSDPGKGNIDPNASAGGNAGEIKFPANWKDAIDPEIRDSAYMKLVNDVPTLAKNYANVQKMIGADKVPIPGKDATTEEWKEAFHKLGNPRDIKEYNVEMDDATKAGVDATFMDKFKEVAHKNGVLPKQATEMVKWFAEVNKQAWADLEKSNEQTLAQGQADLKKEWGASYDANLVRAKAAIAEFADKETAEVMRNLGLGKNATFLKFMSKVGATLSEDKIRGQGTENFSGGLTPAEAQGKIKEITNNSKSPYYDKNNEKHLEVKKEVDRLYAMAYPTAKNS